MSDNLFYSYNLDFSYPVSNIDPQPNGNFLGTASFSFYSDVPVPDFEVGDTLVLWLPDSIVPNRFYKILDLDSDKYSFDFDNFPVLVVDKISVNDNVIGTAFGTPFRQWLITVDGFLRRKQMLLIGNWKPIISNFNVKAEPDEHYSVDNPLIKYSGSFQSSNFGNNPEPVIGIGGVFAFPGFRNVNFICCNYSCSDEFDAFGQHVWKITYDCVSVDDNATLPETEFSVTHELNGSTVRSVSGELIALRRSSTPITKKSITVYSDLDSPIATPGSTYEGGIVLSENIIKETIKNDGMVTAQYYKHSIEVEA